MVALTFHPARLQPSAVRVSCFTLQISEDFEVCPLLMSLPYSQDPEPPIRSYESWKYQVKHLSKDTSRCRTLTRPQHNPPLAPTTHARAAILPSLDTKEGLQATVVTYNTVLRAACHDGPVPNAPGTLPDAHHGQAPFVKGCGLLVPPFFNPLILIRTMSPAIAIAKAALVFRIERLRRHVLRKSSCFCRRGAATNPSLTDLWCCSMGCYDDAECAAAVVGSDHCSE